MNNRSVRRQHNHNVARKTGMKQKRPRNNRGNRVSEIYGSTLIELLRLNVRLGCMFFPLWKLVCHVSQLVISHSCMCPKFWTLCRLQWKAIKTCYMQYRMQRGKLFTAQLWFLRYTHSEVCSIPEETVKSGQYEYLSPSGSVCFTTITVL